jgi:hypothetical protein
MTTQTQNHDSQYYRLVHHLWTTYVSARTGKVAVSKYELLSETTIYEPGMTLSGHSGE